MLGIMVPTRHESKGGRRKLHKHGSEMENCFSTVHCSVSYLGQHMVYLNGCERLFWTGLIEVMEFMKRSIMP
jgi:hypothetical protein